MTIPLDQITRTSPLIPVCRGTGKAALVSGKDASTSLLSVKDLRVQFETASGPCDAVQGVSFELRRGEILAIVGESGSGKSVTAHSIMRLLPKQSARVSGDILFNGRNLVNLTDDEMRALRGREISMIFQEPMTALNPLMTIGHQIAEPLKIHLGMSNAEADARAIELLGQVGIGNGEARLRQYPHQLSGGMRQRVMIAMGLACSPAIIIADEPTTALDVTIQAQILELMHKLTRTLNIALILITHNLGIVARYADRVIVLYAGRVSEDGPAETVFGRPRHPYTIGLLRSVPRLDQPRTPRLYAIDGLPPSVAKSGAGCSFAPRCSFKTLRCAEETPLVLTDSGSLSSCVRAKEIAEGHFIEPQIVHQTPNVEREQDSGSLVSVRGLSKHFHLKGKGQAVILRAVEDVSFDILPGETVGLVGESGCGKTTVGRMILNLERATTGDISINGKSVIGRLRSSQLGKRPVTQVVFQDPFSSLNPRMTIRQTIAEPLLVYDRRLTRQDRESRVIDLLTQVGIRAELADRYPHQLSGGQRQRVGIARALAFEPAFIICDEAVSALDVSIQGQIINLLRDLQKSHGIACLFIAHDLAAVRHISNRVIVMYLGRIMEMGTREDVFDRPLHPYTKLLLDAVPVPDPIVERQRPRRLIEGELPNPLDPPTGCVFRSRCPIAENACSMLIPPLRESAAQHFAACIKL